MSRVVLADSISRKRPSAITAPTWSSYSKTTTTAPRVECCPYKFKSGDEDLRTRILILLRRRLFDFLASIESLGTTPCTLRRRRSHLSLAKSL